MIKILVKLDIIINENERYKIKINKLLYYFLNYFLFKTFFIMKRKIMFLQFNHTQSKVIYFIPKTDNAIYIF